MNDTDTRLPIDPSERQAFRYAVANQGFEGTWVDWLALESDEREQYEMGAQGLPTDGPAN